MSKEAEATTVKRISTIKTKRSSTTTRVNHAVAVHLNDLPDPRNVWDGFAVEPAHGTWDRIKDLILSIICDNNPESFEYVMGWMAAMVQKPDSAGQVALVLSGVDNSSKAMFIHCLCDLMGQHAFRITNFKQVTEKFNSHLKDCVLLIGEGTFCAGDKRAESVLKTMISESSIAIAQKRKDVQIRPNKLHVILSGSTEWVTGLDAGRRLCILKVSDARQDDHAYFSEIASEIANGGLSALLYDLQHFDLDGFDVRDVPRTQG